MNRFLRIATQQAHSHEYECNVDYKLCAMIVRGGSIVSIGFNQRKTNSFVEHYTNKIRGGGRDYCLSTHAEMHAVIQARAKIDLRGCKIFVARIRSSGSKLNNEVGMARPCPICQNVLFSYGIKKAVYTIDDNNYGIMRVVENDISDIIVNSYNTEQI